MHHERAETAGSPKGNPLLRALQTMQRESHFAGLQVSRRCFNLPGAGTVPCVGQVMQIDPAASTCVIKCVSLSDTDPSVARTLEFNIAQLSQMDFAVIELAGANLAAVASAMRRKNRQLFSQGQLGQSA